MDFRYHVRKQSDGPGTKDWICRPSTNGGLIIEFGKTGAKRLRQTLVPPAKCDGGAATEARRRYEEKVREGYQDVAADPSRGDELAHWSSKRILVTDLQQAIELLRSKESTGKLFDSEWAGETLKLTVTTARASENFVINTRAFGGGKIVTKTGLLLMGALASRVPNLSVALADSTTLGGTVAERLSFVRNAGLDVPELREALIESGLKRDLAITATAAAWF